MASSGNYFLGIDVGSVSINTVVMDAHRDIIREYYTRTHGQPLSAAYHVLDEILTTMKVSRIGGVSTTGSGGKLLADLLGSRFENEIIAQGTAVSCLYPRVRTIVEMGGEDSKLILLSKDGQAGGVTITDFTMNAVCAAGTGSFLDQQAHRLGLTVEEFGRLALQSSNPPRIAGRCSVFAKTDMIHLQQVATPDYDIVAGLCRAVARNFKSTLGKGKSLARPVSFQGGVAANLGMRRAFREVLDLSEGELIIPQHFASMGAIGTVFLLLDNLSAAIPFRGLGALKDYSASLSAKKMKGLEPLSPGRQLIGARSPRTRVHGAREKKITVYLGLDVGSISTNVVAIDQENRVLARRYLMTAGRPLEAIKRGLKEVGEEVGDTVTVAAAGTTGSGRYLTGDFIGADVVKNEITAQATAAIAIDPRVDTIFEIGGQDSKYISIANGAIVDFEMNKVCAAGTGSFLEEQAEKLGISIKDEFSRLALDAPCPVSLGERCTVFMESDLVHYQQMGADRASLIAGLSYSIVLNYLNKVVGDRRVGNHIFFQGGTAFNLGVVAAFEKILKKIITVPPNHDVTGAIGAAILAREESGSATSAFKGFDLSKRNYALSSFQCGKCPNRCEIKRLSVKGEPPLFYGSRCERFEINRKKKSVQQQPDLFAERERLLYQVCGDAVPSSPDAPAIGIPRCLFFHELLPFFYTFLSRLGYRVVLSDPTHKQIIHDGVERVISETCFPVKVAHGHIANLLEKGVKAIFFPSVIEMERIHPAANRSFVCPYAQALPYTLRSAFVLEREGVDLVSPVLYFGEGKQAVAKALRPLGKRLGRGASATRRALDAAFDAQDRFYRSLQKRGEEVLGQLLEGDSAMVIVSRPYNGCDTGINLNLPGKINELGILAIPMDFLPLERGGLPSEWREMYWKYGQRILAATHFIQSTPGLHALYLTNFSCGPDSFIGHFFKKNMNGAPYLTIEIDEHSSDVGIITRLEAFLDSIKNARMKPARTASSQRVARAAAPDRTRTVYIPGMSDHARAVAAAFESCGLQAVVLPESDEQTLRWGRKLTTGRECYPCILTTGDMIKMTQQPEFDPERSAFFMASGGGPCRFGQYSRFQRLVLDEMGFSQVPLFTPNQDDGLYQELDTVGKGFSRTAWKGIVSIDLLQKRLREIRPYEKNAGESDGLYRRYLEKICEALRECRETADILKKAWTDFNGVAVNGAERKPVIGIVGEIYIRSNSFGNEHLVANLERLGCEVWLPPFGEWIYYTNYTSKWRSFRTGNYRQFLTTFFTNELQKGVERRLTRSIHNAFRVPGEPHTEDIIEKAAPYLHPSFEGEAILSVGKAVDYVYRGAAGLINTMPFTCMPGTIVNALLKRCREDHGNIPLLSLAYDGQKDSNTRTRIEAFVYQVCQFHERKQHERGGKTGQACIHSPGAGRVPFSAREGASE